MTPMDFLAARLDFPGGRSAHVHVDRCSGERLKRVTVVTRSGDVLLWRDGDLQRLDAERREFSTVYERTEEPLVREVRAFLNPEADGEDVPSDGGFATRVVGILTALASAARAALPSAVPPGMTTLADDP